MNKLRIAFLVTCILFSVSLAGDESRDRNLNSLEGPPKDEKCQLDRLKGCMNVLQNISKDSNLAFPSSDEELDVMCKSMNTGLDCVHGYATKCFSKTQKRLVYQLVRGADDLMQSLCKEGPFREQYLIYAPCMKNLSTDPRVCGAHYRALIRAVDTDSDGQKDAATTHRMQCCTFHSYLQCLTSAAEGTCDQQASRFIEEYSYLTAGHTIQTRCRGYLPGSIRCSGVQERAPTASNRWTFVLLATLHGLLTSMNQ